MKTEKPNQENTLFLLRYISALSAFGVSVQPRVSRADGQPCRWLAVPMVSHADG